MISKRAYIITVILFVLTLSGFLFLMQNKDPKNNVLAENQNPQFVQTKNQLNDEISNSRKNIITNTVEKVSPAIVGISVIEIRQYRDPFSSY